VRELENAVQKAVILGDSDRIRPKEMGLVDDEEDSGEIPATESPNSLYAIRDSAEKEAIRDALSKTAGNVSHCSRILEVDRKVLIRTMERLGIRPEEFK
jgi:two-component system NtrC family response regulator